MKSIYESNSYPGGKLTAFEQDGYRFDTGPSVFAHREPKGFCSRIKDFQLNVH